MLARVPVDLASPPRVPLKVQPVIVVRPLNAGAPAPVGAALGTAEVTALVGPLETVDELSVRRAAEVDTNDSASKQVRKQASQPEQLSVPTSMRPCQQLVLKSEPSAR